MIFFHQNDNMSLETIANAKERHWEKVKSLLKTLKIKLSPQRQKELSMISGKTKQEAYIQKVIIRTLDDFFKPYKFEEIVKADYTTIKGIVNNKWVPPKKIIDIKINPKDFFVDKLYKNYRKKYGHEFVKALGINVCPYCNRNYINGGPRNTMAQVDHYFNKSTYYFLAVTFANLVPSCPYCNHNKGEKDIKISPYDCEYNTDDVVLFSYAHKDRDNIQIKVTPLKDEMEDNIKAFQLQDIYSYHEDIVKELEFKSRCYPQNYTVSIANLLKQVSGLNMMPEEIYYGIFLSCDKYYLRPLSKFTKDIVEQIKTDSTNS